ncbi:MAG: hypothetical protein IKB50_00810 [Clostridia bacterium]|nr:hypothetical protein [Clostridia bacterium]
MKSKSRFLWLYTILLFSVALLLILFAGMTQQEAETHKTTSVGLQESVTKLTQDNENLKAENASLRAEADGVNALKISLEQTADHNGRNELLIKAMSMYCTNDINGARALLAEMDISLLTPEQLAVYNMIMK